MFVVNKLVPMNWGGCAKPDSSEFEKANMEETLLFWSFRYMELQIEFFELQFLQLYTESAHWDDSV